MHKVREVLRLRFGSGLSARQVAASLGIARSTVAEYEQRARAAGVSWPLPAEMDDGALHRVLFGPQAAPAPRRGLPDIAHLRSEMAKPHVTLMLLWSEYKEANPGGYQYYVGPEVMESRGGPCPQRRRRPCRLLSITS